jgi:hypothetical protein
MCTIYGYYNQKNSGLIEFALLEKRSKTAFHTAWEVANREGRLVVDKK